MNTPKVLTEADAAADLAGLPRPVSTTLPAPFGFLCEWATRGGFPATQIVYYGGPGNGIDDDWNCHPEVHKNLPIYTADQLRALAGRVAELEALAERLKLEAQIHAQEARTANSTIAEIYQCVTGATGEPGNWNGAEPVRRRLAELEAALREAQRQLNANAPNCALDTIDAALSTTPESKP